MNNLSSTTNFILIFYISKPGRICDNKAIGNEEGLIIGEYYLFTLIGEGKGSIFPICTDLLSPEILWKFNCEYTDITEDYFSEDNIEIILNRRHRLYKYYEINNKDFNSEMLNSLLSHILTILIMDIRNQEGGKINLDDNSSMGSILSVMKYYNDSLNIRINGSYNDLLESVQTFIYNRCKI